MKECLTLFDRMVIAMRTNGSRGIVGHWLISPHTSCYLVPGLSFEGGIFKGQQMTFVQRLVLHDLAQSRDGLMEQLSAVVQLMRIAD